MPRQCQASKHCKEKPYRNITGAVCLEDVMEKADERDSVAVERDSNGKITSMDLIIG